MTMGFRMVRKPSIWTPLKLSFSLVFFPSVTARLADAAGFQGLRHSADPCSKLQTRVRVFIGLARQQVFSSVHSSSPEPC